ncbi:MAG: hypothetical protein CVU16_13135 [Betaproteobacteria bacterium HGW-Betaproteobacteria-10]|nr:MAG: hypothetical protein CVU16_13135 [Betaproteobacteria bacterium HGW-Betaproteobacteria-10]
MLSQGVWSLNRFAFRFSLPLVLCSLSGSVAAIGLGELRGHPVLGERPRFEIELLGTDKQPLDATCFRLVQPAAAGDLPWLKKASINIRRSTPPVLEIYSETPLREPILQLAVQMTCGVEVSREYLLLVSPRKDIVSPLAEASLARLAPQLPRAKTPHLARSRPVPNNPTDNVPPRSTVKSALKRAKSAPLPDRLTLSGGVESGEPSLRLATELFSWGGTKAEAKEAQREILRLEYRMLLTLHEQVTTQMATAEKLRNMEDTLGELQQRTAEFALRVESGNPQLNVPAASPTLAVPQQALPAASSPIEQAHSVLPPVVKPASGLSELSLYGLLLGALLGLGGWLGWRNYRERQQRLVDDEYLIETSEIQVDPPRDDEQTAPQGVDLHVEPSTSEAPVPVDVELDFEGPLDLVEQAPAAPLDSVFSISAATLDEHFEANPVMELADIMLSFGRVKGAAQALQEYIDNNPQEALQPWIRLMDVYRMADMKAEFETVATNLNRNFNVEIQQWDSASSAPGEPVLDLVLDEAAPPPVAPRAESLEDMPRIMTMVCELWRTGDVVGYLYQLLRDNRGGQRVGFALPVVEEILFLVELKETSNRIE